MESVYDIYEKEIEKINEKPNQRYLKNKKPSLKIYKKKEKSLSSIKKRRSERFFLVRKELNDPIFYFSENEILKCFTCGEKIILFGSGFEEYRKEVESILHPDFCCSCIRSKNNSNG